MTQLLRCERMRLVLDMVRVAVVVADMVGRGVRRGRSGHREDTYLMDMLVQLIWALSRPTTPVCTPLSVLLQVRTELRLKYWNVVDRVPRQPDQGRTNQRARWSCSAGVRGNCLGG